MVALTAALRVVVYERAYDDAALEMGGPQTKLR